ncbi:MAG: M16 family metallopeptidase [Phycisphaerales bacterium]
MSHAIERFDLECGMRLLVEPMGDVQSVGLTWLLPIGSSVDPPGRQGAATMLAEWLWRGAGERDAKAHSDALDTLGVQRSSQITTHHLRIGATLIGSRLDDALPLLTDLVTAPRFDDAPFEAVRDLSIQAIEGLKDEPQQRSMLKLKERHFPTPFNRSGMGTIADLRAMTPDGARSFWRERAKPQGAIMGVAGAVDPQRLVDQLNERLADWRGAAPEATVTDEPERGYHHEADESAQVHIGVAHPAPPETDERSVLQRLAVAVLSGGMSGRLFTEVREKRSLCYSVHASYAAGRDRGAVLAYSGTTPERAQETLDVLVAELRRLRDGADASEFHRAVVGLKSRLVMQGESTAARANAIAADFFTLGRARTLHERADEVDGASLDAVNDYLREHPAEDFTVVTIGPESLTPPKSID